MLLVCLDSDQWNNFTAVHRHITEYNSVENNQEQEPDFLNSPGYQCAFSARRSKMNQF